MQTVRKPYLHHIIHGLTGHYRDKRDIMNHPIQHAEFIIRKIIQAYVYLLSGFYFPRTGDRQ